MNMTQEENQIVGVTMIPAILGHHDCRSWKNNNAGNVRRACRRQGESEGE